MSTLLLQSPLGFDISLPLRPPGCPPPHGRGGSHLTRREVTLKVVLSSSRYVEEYIFACPCFRLLIEFPAMAMTYHFPWNYSGGADDTQSPGRAPGGADCSRPYRYL